MSNSSKDPETDRHHGGPGSSHQRPDLPDPTEARPQPGTPTDANRSDVSGGGGVQDRHHAHEDGRKGGRG